MAKLDKETLRRWRLILGAESAMSDATLSAQDQSRDDTLEFLYRHEQSDQDRSGGRSRPNPSAVTWLGKVRTLFPRSAAETLQQDALKRYKMYDLLSDPHVLGQLEPNLELVQILLSLHQTLPDNVRQQAKQIIAKTVAELEQRLQLRVRALFNRRRSRSWQTGRPRLADIDLQRTLRHNLQHQQLDTEGLILERIFFRARTASHLPWHIWILVDQSGSMSESVIHSAVMASIFGRLRSISAHLVLFSDQVTDASALLHSPEDILLSTQLGGGTNIGEALAYARQHLEIPARTAVILISDLFEGYSEDRVLSEVTALKSSGATILALAALDLQADPYYDRNLAQQLQNCGAQVGAMTPDNLVEWLAQRVHL